MSKNSPVSGRTLYSPMSDTRHDFEPFYAFDPIWNFDSGLHCHDFFELYLHIRGARYYCIDHQVYPLEPNQLIIVPPFTLHGHIGTYIPQDYERAFLYISPDALKKAGSDIIDLDIFFKKCAASGKFQYLMTPEDAHLCAGLLHEMMNTMHDASPVIRFSNYSRMLQFLQLVCQTVQSSAQESIPVIINETMQQILIHINDNFSQPLRLDSLARTFGVSTSYLSHEFYRYTGRSVYDYILYRRIQFAKELVHTGLPLGEISDQCGFGDYSGFLRAFKKVTGMSPNRYRQIHHLSFY